MMCWRKLVVKQFSRISLMESRKFGRIKTSNLSSTKISASWLGGGTTCSLWLTTTLPTSHPWKCHPTSKYSKRKSSPGQKHWSKFVWSLTIGLMCRESTCIWKEFSLGLLISSLCCLMNSINSKTLILSLLDLWRLSIKSPKCLKFWKSAILRKPWSILQLSWSTSKKH